jgi:hypothetical protein
MNIPVLRVNLTFLPGQGNPEKAQMRLYQRSTSISFVNCLLFIYLFIYFKKSRLPLHGNMHIFASIPDCGGDVDVTSLDTLLPSFSLLQ